MARTRIAVRDLPDPNFRRYHRTATLGHAAALVVMGILVWISGIQAVAALLKMDITPGTDSVVSGGLSSVCLSCAALAVSRYLSAPPGSSLTPDQRKLLGLEDTAPIRTVASRSISSGNHTRFSTPNPARTSPAPSTPASHISFRSPEASPHRRTITNMGALERAFSEQIDTRNMSMNSSVSDLGMSSAYPNSPTLTSPTIYSGYNSYGPSSLTYHLSPKPVSSGLHSATHLDTQVSEEAAHEYLRQNNIATPMQSWIWNLRRWFSSMILTKLTKALKDGEKLQQQLSQQGIGQLLGQNVGGITPQAQLQQLEMKLQPYFAIDEGRHQAYVRIRLQELAKDQLLQAYLYSPAKGSRASGSPVGLSMPSPPSDSRLLVHFFLCHFEEQLPPHYRSEFSRQHLITRDQIQAVGPGSIALVEVCRDPSHYRVVSGSEEIEVRSGEDNVFVAIALFLYLVRTKHSNCLFNIDFDSKENQVKRVIGD